jgi:hypothetical protein
MATHPARDVPLPAGATEVDDWADMKHGPENAHLCADRSPNRTSLSMVTTHAWGRHLYCLGRHPYCPCRHPLYLGDAARNF